MTAEEQPAAGRPVSSADTLWEAAAAELTPHKSLERVDARAQQVLGTVSVVGIVLTAFGLVAGTLLGPPSAASWVAQIAAAAALLAVMLALGASLLRVTPALTPGNLLEVEAWYRAQFRRAYAVVAAGWLLVGALALAAIAAALLLARGDAVNPVISMALAGVGAEAKLVVRVEFSGVKPGAQLRTEVTGVRSGGGSQSLARSLTRAGSAGTAATMREVPKPGNYAAARVSAMVDGHRCEATLPLADPVAAATSGCVDP